MNSDYLNKNAEVFLSRLTESERKWAETVIDELRRRYPMADHWTTGGETFKYIDIRIGRKLKGKIKGRPAMFLRGDGSVTLVINKRLVPTGTDRTLTSDAAPQLDKIKAWLDACVLSSAGLKRMQGAGLKPASYSDAESVPDEDELDEDVNSLPPADLPAPTLNLILYGPPGTGKTYATIREALKIIQNTAEPEGDFNFQKQKFEEYRSEGQIAFVTFHQSFSYEDFIEGIRAETSNGQLSYKLRDGIFKRMAITAMYRPAGEITAQTELDFDDLYDEFLKEVGSSLPYAITGAQGGIMEIRSISNKDTLQVTHSGSTLRHGVSRKRMKRLYQAYQSPAELDKKASSKAITDVIGGANVTAYWGALNRLLKFKENVGAELLAEGRDQLSSNEEGDYEQLKRRVLEGEILKPNGKPYVLIIDEINRANMSRVFGELITLIEPSKRAGKPECAEVLLPYSNDRFSVPSNLYIIGTMNTADRSLAMVDTALRRRFDFVEMMPDPELLIRKTVEGVDLVRMLETINLRIEHLYDREHMIGHAFFMDLDQDSTLADVARIFKNKVLPLLEEYFFEDWEKINSILGKSAIYELQPAGNLGFATSGKTFRRNLEKLKFAETYQAIYQNVGAPTLPKASTDA